MPVQACPFCHQVVAPQSVDGQLLCPLCRNTGTMPQPNRLAVTSLVLGISSLLLGLLTGIAAIITGVMALGRVRREQAGGQGKAIGGIVTGAIGSIVGTTIVLAAVVFVLVSDLPETEEQAPNMSFSKHASTGTLRVVLTDPDVPWSSLTWSGDCTMTGLNGGGMPPPTQHVVAGDRISTDCSPGDVLRITHHPSRTTLYDAPF